MKTLFHLPLILLATIAYPLAAQEAKTNPLVGTWVLERFVDRPDGAEPIYPLGKRPVGLFIFTEDGRFSINAMRRQDEPDQTTNAPWTPSWYISYFGTYRYNPDGPSWTTRVEGGNIPSYLGTDQTRPFTVSGDVLTIASSYRDGGRTMRIERVLRRVGGLRRRAEP